MPKSEDFTFRPVDLPNPIWLTSPENMFFIRLRKEGLSPVEAFVRASMKKREMEVRMLSDIATVLVILTDFT